MSTTLHTWDVENPEFWEHEGKRIAKRNLWISIYCLMLAFAMWQVWSVAVTNLNNVGFHLSTEEKFWLVALPGLSGATFRIFYSFLTPIFGGGRWNTISTATLLIPAVWMGFAVQDPTTPYSVLVIIALLCGFGGGHFSSSMSNISFFYPKKSKGTALGLNAGIGNLGVSVVQLCVPIVVGISLFGLGGAQEVQKVVNGQTVIHMMHLQNAGWIWVPFIVLAVLLSHFGMNNLATAKSSFADQASIFKRVDNWIMCVLYTGTFGSFIGFAAGFPLVCKSAFPHSPWASLVFFGAMVGALTRPFGGWLSDKIHSGTKITSVVFLAMSIVSLLVMFFLPDEQGNGGSFYAFFACFLVLFALTGIGNGSTFAQIPGIFRKIHFNLVREGKEKEADRDYNINKESAAVIGFTSAIAAYGAFFAPKILGWSYSSSHSFRPAFIAYSIFFLICLLINVLRYQLRERVEKKAVSPQ